MMTEIELQRKVDRFETAMRELEYLAQSIVLEHVKDPRKIEEYFGEIFKSVRAAYRTWED